MCAVLPLCRQSWALQLLQLLQLFGARIRCNLLSPLCCRCLTAEPLLNGAGTESTNACAGCMQQGRVNPTKSAAAAAAAREACSEYTIWGISDGFSSYTVLEEPLS